MKLAKITLAIGMSVLGVTSLDSRLASAQEKGDLKIRFEYGGNPFEPAKIDANKDPQFCGDKNLVNEKLIVNPDNKGIENIMVYVYTGRKGSELPEYPPSSEKHVLANSNCRFDPHIVIMQTGDTLDITNPDPVGHNANIGFFKNNPVNFMIPPSSEKSVVLDKAEPAPIGVACNIHPWMLAHVLVLEHPFAAKSDANGDLKIEGLPAGGKLVFRVWSEAGTISDVTIDGKAEEWKSQRFEVDIKPGMNDLGTVIIPGDALKAD